MIYKEFVVKTGSGMNFEDVIKHFSNTRDNTIPIISLARTYLGKEFFSAFNENGCSCIMNKKEGSSYEYNS